MMALSIRQPWCWHILHNGKDIENRDWLTHVRGRILIHASRGMTRDEYDMASFAPLPAMDELPRGGIVGSVDIVDCVTDSDSPWFFGRFGFVLRDPRPLPFVPLAGKLKFFRVPDSLYPALEEAP